MNTGCLLTSHPSEKLMRASGTGTQGCALSNVYCLLQYHYVQLYFMIFMCHVTIVEKDICCTAEPCDRDLKGCHSMLGAVTEALSNRDNCF